MRTRKKSAQKFVVCIDNSEYDGDLRVIDESGEDYLYPNSFFIPIRVPVKVEQSIIHTT
jgi:hypothetical protein